MPRNPLRALSALLPVVALAAPLALAQPAAAVVRTTITPDTFLDVANPVCGDLGHVLGTCSLRGAVIKANQTNLVDVTLLAGTYHLSIAQVARSNDDASSGDLEIGTSMSLTGAGATQTKIVADPGFDDRVIEVDPDFLEGAGISVSISDLTVSGGNAVGTFSGETTGGGILNQGQTLAVHNVIVDGNQSTADSDGGGILSLGLLTVTNSTISNNIAAHNGGGLFNRTSVTGTDTFRNLLFMNNTANGVRPAFDVGGGAIYNQVDSPTGVARYSDITALNNKATGMSGGGVYEDSDVLATVTYDRMTLGGNTAVFEGAGFYEGTGNAVITNSTISGNNLVAPSLVLSAQPRLVINPNIDGGGVAIGVVSGKLTLNNSTVSGNSTYSGTGGGLFLARGETMVLHNTLVTGNTAGSGGAISNCHNSFGTLTSNGYNIADDLTCALGATDRQGSAFDPHLGPLAANGGAVNGAPGASAPTSTRALPAGSVAIDTADPANCPATDQRGITRPQGPRCDVGAYEVLAAVATPTPALPKAGAAGGGGANPWVGVLVAILVGWGGLAALRTRRA